LSELNDDDDDVSNSEVRSQATEVASETSEPADKSLLDSNAGQSTHRLFAAFSLADLTTGNQSEQRYTTLSCLLSSLNSTGAVA